MAPIEPPRVARTRNPARVAAFARGLSAEGRFTSLTEGAGARRPRVLLARELCSFEWFEPAGGRAAADQAARLYARASAPFNNPGDGHQSFKGTLIGNYTADIVNTQTVTLSINKAF